MDDTELGAGSPDERPSLQPVREDWDRALAVVAHPDDLEYGVAAAVARWTDAGKSVVYALATSGEAGIDTMHPDETKIVREAEQQEACRLVGVDDLRFLGFQDGVVVQGLPLRAAIARVVREVRPEIVITINFSDTWDGATMLNQSDHIAVGRATLDAVRDAANRWVFADQLVDGLEPWSGVREVWVAASPTAKHAADVSTTYDRGVASLRAHKAYLQALDGSHDPWDMLDQAARWCGERLGTERATTFEVFPIS